jgi:hypothetical protein
MLGKEPKVNRGRARPARRVPSPSDQSGLADAMLGIWRVLELCLLCAPKMASCDASDAGAPRPSART